MQFLIQGNLEDVMVSFGDRSLIAPGVEEDPISKDIYRTRSFGVPVQCQQHVAIWSDPSQSPPECYLQGNMSAGNLKFLFNKKETPGIPLAFFTRAELASENPLVKIMPHLSLSHFSYIDDAGQPRGLLIFYRKDDPSKWMIAHTENPNKLPQEVQVKILTSFDPRPFLCSNDRPCTITETRASGPNSLTDSIGTPILTKFIRQIIGLNSRINVAANKIDLFTPMVSEQFPDNQTLLETFNQRMDEVWTNRAFTILRNIDAPLLELTPRQLSDCFNPDSVLYQQITQGNWIKDRQRLEVIIFLDKWGLNHRQEAIAADQAFDKALHDLMGGGTGCSHEFLANCLADDRAMKCLQFLMKITKDNLHVNFACQLSQIGNPLIWGSLAFLADLEWGERELKYFYPFLCRYLLNSPTTSVDGLLPLWRAVTEILQDVFEPVKLADFLVRLGPIKEQIQFLQQAQEQLPQILKEFEHFNRWRGTSLSPGLLSAVAERYMQNPRDPYLNWFNMCSSAEQFVAACSLADVQMSVTHIKTLVLVPIYLSIVNDLRKYKLDLRLLEDSNMLPPLIAIRTIEAAQERDACLILFAQGQINADDYDQFRASCQTCPELAGRIVALHRVGFAASDLRHLAFDSTMYHTTILLTSIGLNYRFNDLSPLFCQTCVAAADLTKEYKTNPIVQGYLKAILPALMPFYRRDFPLVDMKKVLAGAKGVAMRKLAIIGSDATEVINKVDAFLDGQATLCSRVWDLGLPPERLLIENREHASEAARAIEQVYYATQEDRSYDRYRTISAQILSGFARLPANAIIDETITCSAVDALIHYESINPEEAAQLPFELLLTHRELTSVIPALSAHNLSVLPLLDGEKPVNREILKALNQLIKLSPENKEAFELAMQEDDKGHDFRMLLTMIPRLKQPRPELVALLVSGIERERINPVQLSKLDAFKSSSLQTKQLARRLDERLVLVNRLRQLSVNNELIDFMFKKDKKSECFCKAVARIEAESQVIMRRLRSEKSTKYRALQAGPEQQYRLTLYRAMYNALNANKSMTKDQLKDELERAISLAQGHIEKIVEVDHSPLLRKSLMLIANFVLAVLSVVTLGMIEMADVGFYSNYQKTGDMFLFTRPASETSFRTINKRTLDDVKEIINTTSPVVYEA